MFSLFAGFCERLFRYSHLIEEVSGTAEFVHNEECVADIHADCSLERRFEDDVSAHCLPVAVECCTNKFAFCVENRTS